MTVEEIDAELKQWRLALRWAFLGLIFAGFTLIFEVAFIVLLIIGGGLQTVAILGIGSFITAKYCMWCSGKERPR